MFLFKRDDTIYQLVLNSWFITLALLTIGILVFDGGYRATFTGIPPAAPRAGGAITN